jgi:hypothetical protein
MRAREILIPRNCVRRSTSVVEGQRDLNNLRMA